MIWDPMGLMWCQCYYIHTISHDSQYNGYSQRLYAHVPVCRGIFPLDRVDSKLASSQWETTLLCNDVSHWLGANLVSALLDIIGRGQMGPTTSVNWTFMNTDFHVKVQHKDLCTLNVDTFRQVLLKDKIIWRSGIRSLLIWYPLLDTEYIVRLQ